MVINLKDDQSVSEGRDIQHVEKCGFAQANFIPIFQQLDIILKKKSEMVIGVALNLKESAANSEVLMCQTKIPTLKCVTDPKIIEVDVII